LQRLRSVKESEEIDLIQHACNITEKGFRRLLPFVKPNVTEYEIEAELIHEFIVTALKALPTRQLLLRATTPMCCIISKTTNNVKLAI
jgi:Xaa-Pro aminopeptidase